MFVKVLTLLVILGACLALPAEDSKRPVPVPVKIPPLNAQGPPSKQPKSDNSDLKTDPSTWWHSSWWHSYPVYYHHVPSVPTYTYWTHY